MALLLPTSERNSAETEQPGAEGLATEIQLLSPHRGIQRGMLPRCASALDTVGLLGVFDLEILSELGLVVIQSFLVLMSFISHLLALSFCV